MSTGLESSGVAMDRDVALDVYRRMVRIRKSDERIRMGMMGGEFGFAYWPVEGHEAISAAACASLAPGDQVVTTYRGLSDSVGQGVPLGPYFAELMGKGTGLSKGKAGAMGVCAPEVGLAWATGIVGEGPPIANGLALAAQLRKDGSVVVVSFGDGATSIGFVHEAMNMAGVWDLPVVFLCQNNAYAECTPIAEYTRTTSFADRAAGYGFTGVSVDGTDPVAVYGAMTEAVGRARRGEGPTLVEAVAFRLQGHYFGDPMNYVDQAKLAAARQKDPVTMFRGRLVESGILADADLAAIDEEIGREVEEAMQFAMESEPPPADELFRDVYAGVSGDGSVSRSLPGPGARSGDAEVPSGGETEQLGLGQAITRTLDRALERDPAIILLGEDIADPAGGIFKMTAGLSTKHGLDRVRSTPIAESAIVGAAVGLSLAGYKAVPEIMFMDFLGVCLDQLANHAAKVRYMSGGRRSVPMTLRVAVGAGSGAQHSQSMEGWITHVPGLKVVFPSDPIDAVGLLNSCFEDEDPTVFIEARTLCMNGRTSAVPTADYSIPLGRASVKREGRDATIVAYGQTVLDALAAADQLAASGTEVEVIDLRTLVPLDLGAILESVGKTKRLVVTHVATQFCGPGAEIAAAVQAELFGELAAPIQRVGAAFTPVPLARNLELDALPSAAKIAAAVEATLK